MLAQQHALLAQSATNKSMVKGHKILFPPPKTGQTRKRRWREWTTRLRVACATSMHRKSYASTIATLCIEYRFLQSSCCTACQTLLWRAKSLHAKRVGIIFRSTMLSQGYIKALYLSFPAYACIRQLWLSTAHHIPNMYPDKQPPRRSTEV